MKYAVFLVFNLFSLADIDSHSLNIEIYIGRAEWVKIKYSYILLRLQIILLLKMIIGKLFYICLFVVVLIRLLRFEELFLLTYFGTFCSLAISKSTQQRSNCSYAFPNLVSNLHMLELSK
jgi:hypothetical protein